MRVVHVIPVATIGGIWTHVRTFATQAPKSVSVKVIAVFQAGEHDRAPLDSKGCHRLDWPRDEHRDRAGIVRSLSPLLESLQPDIIVSHHVYTDLFVLPAAREASLPVVVRTVHGVLQVDPTDNPDRKQLRTDWNPTEISTELAHERDCKATICVAAFLRQKLVGYGFPPSKLHVIRNGVPLPPRITRHSGLGGQLTARVNTQTKRTRIVGFAGRFEPAKNVAAIPQVLWHLRELGIRSRCLVAGAGQQEQELRLAAAHLGLEHEITIEPLIPRIESFLARIEVLLIPSLAEGCPYLLLEAMAWGVPVVAAKIPGITEIVESSGAAYLFSHPDYLGAAQEVRTVLCDSARRSSLIQTARREIEQRFTASRVVEATLRLYDRLADSVRR